MTFISALWSRFAGYIVALGTLIALIIGAFMKGQSVQKAKSEIKDLKDANQIRKDGADARAGVNPDKLHSDGWRRD